MTDVNKNIVTEIEVWANEKSVKYKGRILGLITDGEFNAIMKSHDLQKKVATKETIRISEITENYKDLSGHRLVMAIKHKNGVNIIGRKLFISERLYLLSYVSSEKNECGFTGISSSYLFIKEAEGKV